MAILYQRGRFWWASGYDGEGVRWAESTHQTDKQAAKLVARQIELRFAADPAARSRSKLTVEKALRLVLEYQRNAGRAAATIRASTYHAQHLIAHLDPGAPLARITLADTTNYLRARLNEGADRHTVAKEIGMLTQAMRRAAKLGLYVPTLDPSHFTPDELGRVYTPRERWLPPHEFQALYDVLFQSRSVWARDEYLLLYCHAGLRRAELFTVRPEDYQADAHALRVRGTKTVEADRWVPLTEPAELVLQRRIALGVHPLFPAWDSIGRDLARACERVGIAPVTPNDLRRTFCSWLCNAGVAERTCAELMGHTSTLMVRAVYGHLDRAGMARAVSQITVASPVAVNRRFGPSVAAQVVSQNPATPENPSENLALPE